MPSLMGYELTYQRKSIFYTKHSDEDYVIHFQQILAIFCSSSEVEDSSFSSSLQYSSSRLWTNKEKRRVEKTCKNCRDIIQNSSILCIIQELQTLYFPLFLKRYFIDIYRMIGIFLQSPIKQKSTYILLIKVVQLMWFSPLLL